ncbi:ankyrin repeat-containing domain protein, partial [Russula compacta]
PLVAALYREHFQVAELLHRHGADVDVWGESEATPLQSACEGGRVDMVRWLLNHGADVNAHDIQFFSPL